MPTKIIDLTLSALPGLFLLTVILCKDSVWFEKTVNTLKALVSCFFENPTLSCQNLSHFFHYRQAQTPPSKCLNRLKQDIKNRVVEELRFKPSYLKECLDLDCRMHWNNDVNRGHRGAVRFPGLFLRSLKQEVLCTLFLKNYVSRQAFIVDMLKIERQFKEKESEDTSEKQNKQNRAKRWLDNVQSGRALQCSDLSLINVEEVLPPMRVGGRILVDGKFSVTIREKDKDEN